MYKYISMKDYEEKFPSMWNTHRQFYLYRTSGTRFNISVENVDIRNIGIGLDRREEAAVGNFDIDEADHNEFANDFVEKFCDYLSINDLKFLIDKLQKELSEQEAQRDEYIRNI